MTNKERYSKWTAELEFVPRRHAVSPAQARVVQIYYYAPANANRWYLGRSGSDGRQMENRRSVPAAQGADGQNGFGVLLPAVLARQFMRRCHARLGIQDQRACNVPRG